MNIKKLYSVLGNFFVNYKKFVIGTMVIAVFTAGVFFSSKIDFNSGQVATYQTTKQESEVLGTSESEDDIEETPTPTTTREVLLNEAEEDIVVPTSTPTPTKSNDSSVNIPTFNNSWNPITPTPIHTNNTVIIVEVTPTPPPPTQPPIPTVFISPEVENALSELNQTLIYIGNQTVPLSVIQGRKQQAFQNWIAAHQDEYAVILSTHYVNSLNAILAANGL